MATPQMVKSKIQNLINASNNVTGKTDTTLTDSFNSLISLRDETKLNIHYGNTAPEDTSMLWCKCNKPEKTLINFDINGNDSIETNIVEEMPESIKGVVRAYLYDNNIYVCRFDGWGSMHSYNLETKEWNEPKNPPAFFETTPSYVAVAQVGSKLYGFGGSNSSVGRVYDSIWKYDLLTGVTTKLSCVLPTATDYMTAEVVDNKIYLFGGDGQLGYYVFNIDTEEIYSANADSQFYYYNYSSAKVGQKIYLFGGLDEDDGTTTSTIQIFDTVLRSITNKDLPVALYNISTAVIGDKIYLFGGRTSHSEQVDTIYIYDTETDNISLSNVSLPLKAYGMGAVFANGSIYLLGGESGYFSVTRITQIHRFIPSINLTPENNTMAIKSSTSNNIFNMLNKDIILQLGVDAVYLSDENMYQLVDTFIYKNNEWISIY